MPRRELEVDVKRREFFGVLSGATSWALAAHAQEPGRTYPLGVLSPNPTQYFHLEMLKELGRAGFIEGQNLVVDWQTYGQRIELVADLAAQLVKAQPDVIFAGGDFAIRAVQNATSAIPITSLTDDIVGAGLVDSLARPGRNTTGINLLAHLHYDTC